MAKKLKSTKKNDNSENYTVDDYLRCSDDWMEEFQGRKEAEEKADGNLFKGALLGFVIGKIFKIF